MNWRTRLIALLGLCLMLASCGGDQPTAELTTKDPVLEDVTSSTDDEIVVEAGAVAEDLDQSSAPDSDAFVPEAPVLINPAGRQDAQSVGGVEAETASDVADEPAAESDVDSSVAPPPAVASAPAPTGPVIDVPLPSAAFAPGEVANTSADGSSSTADAAPTRGLAVVPDRSPDSCGSNCEIGGTDFDTIEPTGQPGEIEVVETAAPSVAELAPDLDAICPEGSGDGCVADVDLAVEEVDAVSADEDGTVEPTCETRPWMVGCDGPVPEPGDYEPQEVIRAEPDTSEGVQVPQEVQDALLAPVD